VLGSDTGSRVKGISIRAHVHKIFSSYYNTGQVSVDMRRQNWKNANIETMHQHCWDY